MNVHGGATSMGRFLAAGALALGGMAGLGCERESGVALGTPREEARPQTAAAQPGASARIAHALCNQRQRCREIGPSQRWETHPACMSDVLGRRAGALDAESCPGGIDEAELAECIRAIEDEDCGDLTESLERVVACRTSDICRN